MDDDDLRALWAAHEAKLDHRVRVDAERLRARSTLAPLRWARGLGIAIGALLLLATGGFVADHLDEPWYALCGLAVHAWLVGVVGSSIYQLVLLARVDYAGPVAPMQRAVERATLAEYRAFTWLFPAGVMLWVPALLVLVRALGGDLLAHVPLAWVLSNIALGAVLLVAARWWSRTHVERADQPAWARRLVEVLSGRRLARAKAAVAEIAAFERE